MATITVKDSPQDLISKVQFSSKHTETLLSASWDSKLRLYTVEQENNVGCLMQTCQFNAPLLDATWDNQSTIYVGGLEKRVYKVDPNTGAQDIVGKDHDQAIKGLHFSRELNAIISGSWDKSLQFIDPRSNESQFIDLPGKVFAMDASDRFLVVGMANRQFHIYDFRNLPQPVQRRESSLKYATRTVRCMPDGLGYASTSIEGRVAVEFFDPSPEVQAQKYAFKCHRLVDKFGGVDTVTPVNSIAFHPIYGTFFSGGSDCSVCLWDHKAKKRLKQYQPMPFSVMSLDVDNRGTMLAIGCSNDSFKHDPLNNGPKPAESTIIIRELGTEEGKSKK